MKTNCFELHDGLKIKFCYRKSKLWRFSTKLGGKCLSRGRNLQE